MREYAAMVLGVRCMLTMPSKFRFTGLWFLLGLLAYGGLATDACAQQRFILNSLSLEPTDTLLVRVGGVIPEVEHDIYDVQGNATLEGRVNLEFINGYQAAVGDVIGFLQAPTIEQQFRSHFFPIAPPENVAVRFNQTLTSVEAEFVAPSFNNTLVATVPDSLWSNPSNWSQGQTPDSTNALTLLGNSPDGEQRLRVLGGPITGAVPFAAHQLTLRGDTATMVVEVRDGAHLSATTNTLIEQNARLELLSGGTLATNQLTVGPSGTVLMDAGVIETGVDQADVFGSLRGTGNVIGGLKLSDSSSTQPGGEIVVDAATGDPGSFIRVQGDYSQSLRSRLSLDAVSAEEGFHEQLRVDNVATLDGTLAVDLTNFDDFQLGTTFKVLTADFITPGSAFRRVEVTGNLRGTGLWAGAKYDYPGSGGAIVPFGIGASVSIVGYSVGDMNGDFLFDQDDVDLFALALRDREAYELTELPGGGIIGVSADITGDTDFDGDLDFDDIDDMISLLPTPAALYAQQVLLGIQVPEPSSLVLISLGGLVLVWKRKR